MSKISIYQVFTRLFGNTNTNYVWNGSSKENGVGKMSDFTDIALHEIKKLGITHVWYTGIIEHARCEGNSKLNIPVGYPSIIKGKAGSPYAITDYYDVNPDLADVPESRMKEFEAMIARTKKNGLKVIIDFVPNHVARAYHSDVFPDKDFGISDDVTKAFDPQNDFYYQPNEALVLPENCGTKVDLEDFKPYEEFPAKATGNDNFSAFPTNNDWYETVKLNYGVDYLNGRHNHFEPQPPLWDKMLDILLYWSSKGIDGFRCDMVEMVPVEFWAFAIPKVKETYPTVDFFAEVYSPNLYGAYIHQGKFDYLYDKVGLYDTLKDIVQGNKPAEAITHCWQSLQELDSHMLRFLENHDEQRFANDSFAGSVKSTLPLWMVSTFLNTGPIMTYFGQEVGEPAIGESGYSGDDGRTTIFDYYAVPEFQKWVNGKKYDGGLLSTEQKELRATYAKVLNFSLNNEAIGQGEFYDLMWVNGFEGGPNKQFIYAFLRYTTDQKLLVLVNFNQHHTEHFLLRIPEDALNVMGYESASALVMNPLLFKGNSLMIPRQGLIDTGAWFNLPANGGQIFQIE